MALPAQGHGSAVFSATGERQPSPGRSAETSLAGGRQEGGLGGSQGSGCLTEGGVLGLRDEHQVEMGGSQMLSGGVGRGHTVRPRLEV